MRRAVLLVSILIVIGLVVITQFWSSGIGHWASFSSDQGGRQLVIAPTPTVVATHTPTVVLIPRPTKTPAPPQPTRVGADIPPQVNAGQIAVIDESSGELIYGFNEHERTPMASTTKIVTAMVALERGKLRDMIYVDYDPNKLYDSTAMGCLPGERYSLEDLLYGLMLPSGNDAALAIANYVAGSEEAFVQMMNDKVSQLGLRDTHFVNPHGLHDPDHYSTAYDMAMLARHAMKTPTFRELAAAKYWDVQGTKSYRIFNLNRLLWEYEWADGVKIGFTEEAGRTTVASATRDGQRVYVALMHGGDIVDDVTPLFDYVFDNYVWSDTTAELEPE